jgi:chorismate synthase
MSANQFGERFKIITFGESHGTALGAVIDGCPAGIDFNFELLNKNMDRRRPGSSKIVSGRSESDAPEILSGVFEGKTLGTPIAVMVRNQDARSKDYEEVKSKARVGHADDMWKEKFQHSDHRGGGRSSGRETLSRVIAGSVAQMMVQTLYPQTEVVGVAIQIGSIEHELNQMNEIELEKFLKSDLSNLTTNLVDQFSSRMPNEQKNNEIEKLLLEAKSTGKSYGGKIRLFIKNPPSYLGQPVFHKFKSDLGAAFLSIGATSAVTLGAGELATSSEGSQFHSQHGTSHYGGVRGGITTGETIYLDIFFKPTATVLDVAKKGRHDPCIVPRAVPVVEAMAWIVLADHILWRRQDQVIFK